MSGTISFCPRHARRSFSEGGCGGSVRERGRRGLRLTSLSTKPVEKLTPSEAKAELDRLPREIAGHDRRYYREDAPTLLDFEYDELRKRNAEIEARFPGLVRPDSPSQRVGAKPSEKFGKVVHRVAMLSLDNAFADEDVVDFAARVRRFLA